MHRRNTNIRWAAASSWVVALGLRLWFVLSVIRDNSATAIEQFCKDSEGYLHLAQNLATDGVYAQADHLSRHLAALRPPGYPAFCALFEWMGWSPDGVLVAQAVIGSFIAPLAVWLAWGFLRNATGAVCVGLLVALSPTGIGLTGIVMADLLQALGLAGGLLLLDRGVVRRRGLWICAAGLVFGLSVLVKPIMMFWPPASVAVWWFTARDAGRRMRWGIVPAFLLLQILPMGAWAVRNYQVEGVPAVTIISAQSLRCYVMPVVSLWAENGARPTNDMILHERTPDWDEELEALRQNQTLPADVQQRQMQESLPVLRAHPWLTAAVWLGSIRENLFSRWQYFPVQLPSMGFLQRVLVGSLSVTRYTQLLWYLCLPVLVVGWMRRRRLLLSIHSGLALLIVVGFFVSLSGGTYWAGSRILYPVEFVLHILMVAGLLQIFQYVKGLIAGQPDNQQR